MELLETLYNKPNNITSTKDYWVTINDKEYLDLLLGSTAFIFGFSNEHILQKIREVQNTVSFIKDCSTEQTEYNTALINKICTAGSFEGLAWAVSGSDGVEVALYTNENYWRNKNEYKPKVITFNPNYHGATYLPRTLRDENYHNTVMVAGPGWDDISLREQTEKECLLRVENALASDEQIGAVLMEGCPWMQRLRPWSKVWWQGIRDICDNYGVNLIVDDVFAGYGKTGNIFTHTQFNIQPDIVALGKSLTGGFTPLSCACATKKITDHAANGWDFSHTWTPSMAGVGAGLAVLELFNTKDIEQTQSKLLMMAEKLEKMGLVAQITSQGLLMQLDLVNKYPHDILSKHGLSGFLKGEHAIMICAPANADDEYFNQLESRLLAALNDV